MLWLLSKGVLYKIGLNFLICKNENESNCSLLSHLSRVRLCATPQTAAHQASPSLGFSRKEHWSGLPFPSPMHKSEKEKWRCSIVSDCSDPMDCSLTGSSVHGIFQAKVLIDSYYWAWYMKWWPQGIDSTADKLPLPYVVFRTQHPYGNSGWMPQTIMYLLSPIDNWSSTWPDGSCNLSDMFTSRKQDS